MIQIMGGSEDSEPFKLFVDLTVRAFLVVRQYREHLYNVVELIYESGMGCFMPESLQVSQKLIFRGSKRGSWRTRMTSLLPSR